MSIYRLSGDGVGGRQRPGRVQRNGGLLQPRPAALFAVARRQQRKHRRHPLWNKSDRWGKCGGRVMQLKVTSGLHMGKYIA